MRAALISMSVVAILAVGVCIFSVLLVGNTVSELEEMRTEVLKLADAGLNQEARLRLQQMAGVWTEQERLLAVLVSHEALHDITALIIEGHANLTAGDTDDFARSMALLGEALRHLHAEEELVLSNLLAIC